MSPLTKRWRELQEEKGELGARLRDLERIPSKLRAVRSSARDLESALSGLASSCPPFSGAP